MTKIALTITPDTEYLTPDQIDAAMARTIGTLQRLGIVPLRKIVLNVECQDEIDGELEDTIDAALSARPVGIEVTLKTTRERHVSRDTLAPVTPMDEAGWDGVTRDVMIGRSRLEEAPRTPGERAVDWLANREFVSSDREPR